MKNRFVFVLVSLLFAMISFAQADTTFAERLGYPKGKKVVILHVDDVGMSFDSNKGAIDALTKGVANSCNDAMCMGASVCSFLKTTSRDRCRITLDINI
jgi:hypothetical protein